MEFPGSRVNGNLLVAYCREEGLATPSTLSVSAGWTIGYAVQQGNPRPAIVAYAYVTGSETAPTFTASAGSDSFIAQVLQYSGTIGSSPFGNATTGWHDGTTGFDGGSNVPMRCPSILTAHPGSTALNIALINPGVTAAPSTPTGWTSRTTTTQVANVSDMALATGGTYTGGIMLAADPAHANWTEIIVEIRSQ